MKIFVTGVSSGIGRALSQALLARGDQVWGVARVYEQTRAERFVPDVVVLNAGVLEIRRTGVQFKAMHFGPVDTPVVPRFAQAQRPRWVLSAADAAGCVMRVLEKRGDRFYYPWSSWVIRVTSVVPDAWFHDLTKRFRR